MSPAEVTEKLGLHRMRDRLWYVHPRSVRSSSVLFYLLMPLICSCATTGEGLFEGLQWLSNTVRRQQK
jgi:ADP-ribosylation factor 6